MIKQLVPLFLFVLLSLVASEVYFKENFENGIDRWVVSDWKGDAQGKFEWSAGDNVGKGYENVKGLRTTEDNKYYTASVRFDKEFSNRGKDLVVQYSVKNERNIECGGGYIKLYPGDFDQKHLDGEQKYNIMFGPDVCGATKRVHFILHYNGENYLIKKSIKPETDTLPHLYTLIIHPDNTYEIRIDGKSKAKGSIEEDFDILPPKEIKDPSVSKPEDWVDLKEIDDPNDVKPADWDVPEFIEDPNAVKPEDWDDEVDGDWEAPRIPNPEYKGEWKPRKIPNPDYKGEWVHPMIPNPDYKPNPELYAYDSFTAIGIEVWQVRASSVFNDFLITDSVEEAEKVVDEFLKRQQAEKEERDRKDEEIKKHREEMAKKAEEEIKAQGEDSETKEQRVQEETEQAVKEETKNTETKDEL